MIVHPRFLVEEIRHGGKQALTFVVCVALSIATLTALNSFKRDVHTSLIDEARALQGGDIIIHAHRPISAELQQAVTRLADNRLLEQQRSTSFYTVALADQSERSLFVNTKAVEPGYPFYGTVSLASGRKLGGVLKPGAVVAAQEVLERLDIEPGDQITIGEVGFTVADTVTYESMKPVSFLSLGPRVFIAMEDVDRLGLVGKGSRTAHEILIKASDPRNIELIERQLRSRDVPRVERVEKAQDSRSRVKVFFDNLLFFLSCISILTLILSGIGMQGSLFAILRQKQRVIAVTKAFGASNRFLVIQYLLMVSVMGFFGSILGIILGYGIKRLFPAIFADLLPESIGYRFHFADTLEGIILGFLVVTVFTLLPLQRLGAVKPVMIFRHETEMQPRKNSMLIAASVFVIFLFLLVVRQI
ncbi:MAG: ABC transporter permease, partial [Desulfofustis sp.]